MGAYYDPVEGMDLLRAQRGLLVWLAPQLGLAQATLSYWREVPAEQVLLVEHFTGIPRHLLRPAIYRPPWRREAEKSVKRNIKKLISQPVENA